MRLVLTGALLATLSVPAFAADLPAPYPVKAAVVAVPEFSWTGFYIGANLGGAWSDGDGNANVDPFGYGPISGSASSFIYGAQIGYNYQVGSWVFGLETDLQGATSGGSMEGIAGSTPYAFDADVDYFGTIRARVGYTWDRLMLYGTGGAVYGKNSSSGVIGGVAFDNSETYWTWTLGAGLEYAFADNWSIKGEYLYIGTPSDVATAYGTTAIDGDINTNIVRVGVNYRF